jgi:hypothetical protein
MSSVLCTLDASDVPCCHTFIVTDSVYYSRMDHASKHGAGTAVVSAFLVGLIRTAQWAGPRCSTFVAATLSVWAAGSSASVVYWLAFSRKQHDMIGILVGSTVFLALGVGVGIAGILVEWVIVNH